ncbi:tetratricopeptide repeat protein [uncultured Thiodictyon sp.]|uniref:tetratricopeptide repeat protein n=1 Tax=uncultured Thiodictyon sp. TaxID=1846217 RepID=UPI0025E986C3|nr:tetratricopeptide repeat protein [uncultured Thiodictyon sp.]
MTAPPAGDPFQFDYRRHLAAQDLLPQHQEDFQRLVKLLCHAPRFQLLFARIADETYRRLLIDKLQDLLVAAGRPIQTADLSDEQRFPDFDALETWLATAGQGQAVIHLVNTGRWLQGPRVESLNVRRDALAEKLDATLLWWLSPDTLERVAREAPDAWSWRGGVFDVIAEVSGPGEGLRIRPRTPVEAGPLTLAQRSRRLAVLHEQLDGVGSAAIPNDLRLNLLLEQAHLYRSLGQWDLADQTLRQQALPLAERLGDVRAKAITQGRIADILDARGELDEALRIRTEEQLPVFERLGDLGAKAWAQGQIADILRARGELDEALALHAQRLPIAQQMSDIDSIAHIRFSMSRLRLQRGDHQTGGLQQIYEDLAESFGILLKLGRPDRIGAVGQLLAQVTVLRGQREEALAVLDTAEQAFAKIGRTAGVEQVRALRATIVGGAGAPIA